MYGEKAINLIKELNRNKNNIPPYNIDLVEQVVKEQKLLLEENHRDAQASMDQTAGMVHYVPTVRIRHLIIQRNQRCLLAYHYNRIQWLKKLRWEFGSILPQDIKANLSQSEWNWFAKYSQNLASYMRTIGSDGGTNLGSDLKPPKSLYIEVRCLVDYGKHQLNDGSIILLKKNTRYYLPRRDCEEFIRLQIFEHINN